MRSAIPFVVVGTVFLVFAVWLYATPRIRARHHPDGLRGPTISWRGEFNGRTYSLHQFDRGAHGDVFLLIFLSRSGLNLMFDADENGIVRLRPEGAAKTFTAIGLADARFAIPIGVDRILAGLGMMILLYPFLRRLYIERCKPAKTTDQDKPR